MATHRISKSTAGSQEGTTTTTAANDKALELIKQLADIYGMKLVPKDEDSTCPNCDIIRKENCDLHKFIREASQVVNFPLEEDPSNKLTGLTSLKTHLQKIITDFTRLVRFLKMPICLGDLIRAAQGTPTPKPTPLSAAGPSTSAYLTVAPLPPADLTRKRKYPFDDENKDGESSLNQVMFRQTRQYIRLEALKVQLQIVSHNEACLKEEDFFPLSRNLNQVMLSIIGSLEPQNFWNYINNMKMAESTKVITFMVTPDINVQKDATVNIGLFLSYFNLLKCQGRLGIGRCPPLQNDVYVVPFGKHDPVPSYLLPFNCEAPGIPKEREENCLLAVVIRNLDRPGASDGGGSSD